MSGNVIEHWFSRPWGLNLLLLLPILTIASIVGARRRRWALLQLGRIPALIALVESRRRWNGLRFFCWVTGLSVLAVGIAGPQWGREPTVVTARGRDLVVVLDLSRSMLTDDVLPCRLDKAQQALQELVASLQKRGGHRLGLVAFAGRAKVICPLTHDYDHFLERLADLDSDHLPPDLRPSGADAASGTRIGAGLILAVDAHDPRYLGGKVQDILLLSDGDDPAGDNEWMEGIEAAREAGIPVHVIGIGDPVEGRPVPGGEKGYLLHKGKPVVSKLMEAPLRAIAERTKGSYTAARTGPIGLVELFRSKIEPGPKRESVDEALPEYRQRYPWFIGAALALLALEMLAGRTTRRTASPSKRTAPVGSTMPVARSA